MSDFMCDTNSTERRKGYSNLLAVHAIRHTAVPWDAVPKVLDVERPLETRCKEATERGDERGEARQDQQVEVVRRERNRRHRMPELPEAGRHTSEPRTNTERMSEATYRCRQPRAERGRDLRLAPDEDRIGLAFDRIPRADAQVVHGTDHVVEFHEVRAPQQAEGDGAEESADKALHRLLWRERDKLRAAERHSADVRENVVADDERSGHPEPDETLEDVVHDEMAVGKRQTSPGSEARRS
jgi:hypothetical protein